MEWSYNSRMKMRFPIAACALLLLHATVNAEKKPAAPQPQPVTVPATIDHNRVLVDADVRLPDGSSQRVHAWVDNGNADLYLSRHLATILGLAVSCDDKECSAPAPAAIAIGGMTIPLEGIKQAHIPLKPVSAASVLAPGLNTEINIPATVLRHYDVLVDFPEPQVLHRAAGKHSFSGIERQGADQCRQRTDSDSQPD